MTLRPYLPALFVLILAMGSISHAIQVGHLIENLPEIVIDFSLAGFLGWRAWKIANDGKSAETDILRWEESASAAMMFFGSCIVLFVPLVAIASLHPETHIDFKTMLVFPLLIAPLGAFLVGICRFFWWR